MQACHEDIAKAFAKSPHNIVETDKRRGFAGRACESCHGPGEEHAESADAAKIRNPAKLAAAAADKLCLSCHLNHVHARGAIGKQPRQGPGVLHDLPQGALERRRRSGGARAGGDQSAVRGVPLRVCGRSSRGPITISCPKAR